MIRDKRAKLILGTVGVSLLLIGFPMLLQMFGIIKETSHLTFWNRSIYLQMSWVEISSLAIFGILIGIVGLKMIDWWDKENREYYVQNFPFALLWVVSLYSVYYLFMLFRGFL
jgi:hypothetical protein